MTLVVTPPASANGYCTVAEADAYNLERLSSAAWAGASTEDKEAAIIMASRTLDAMPQAWTGESTDPNTQAMRWPRTGMFSRAGGPLATDVIPRDLKDATAEFARQLIEDASIVADNDVAALGITSVRAGNVAVGFGAKSMEMMQAGIVPGNLTAEGMVTNMVPDYVRAMLVPSWLLATLAQTTAMNQHSLLFENI